MGAGNFVVWANKTNSNAQCACTACTQSHILFLETA